MKEYILYSLAVFIPLGALMFFLLRKQGLSNKNICIIIAFSLMVIMTFPVAINSMGWMLSTFFYIAFLAVLIWYLLNGQEDKTVQVVAEEAVMDISNMKEPVIREIKTVQEMLDAAEAGHDSDKLGDRMVRISNGLLHKDKFKQEELPFEEASLTLENIASGAREDIEQVQEALISDRQGIVTDRIETADKYVPENRDKPEPGVRWEPQTVDKAYFQDKDAVLEEFGTRPMQEQSSRPLDAGDQRLIYEEALAKEKVVQDAPDTAGAVNYETGLKQPQVSAWDDTAAATVRETATEPEAEEYQEDEEHFTVDIPVAKGEIVFSEPAAYGLHADESGAHKMSEAELADEEAGFERGSEEAGYSEETLELEEAIPEPELAVESEPAYIPGTQQSEPGISLDDLIDNGFEAKFAGGWAVAASSFEQAMALAESAELRYLLVSELAYIYREQGFYERSHELLAAYLELDAPADFERQEVIRQIRYVELLMAELDRIGQPRLPYARVPRLIRMNVESAM